MHMTTSAKILFHYLPKELSSNENQRKWFEVNPGI